MTSGVFLRNDSNVWLGQNDSDQGLTVIGDVQNLVVNGTVTITASYTGSVTQVNINGYTITSGILTPDANTITAPVGLGGEVGRNVFVSIVDDNGTSTAFEVFFSPESGNESQAVSYNSGQLPEASIVFNEPGIVAGDIFYYETTSDTGQTINLDDALVQQSYLPQGAHTFGTSWRDSQTAGYDATATQTFTINSTDGQPSPFVFAPILQAGTDLEYKLVADVVGMPAGSSVFVENGEISVDRGE